MSVKYTTPAQHKSDLRNVYGTFAIEGMTISKVREEGLIMFSKYDVYTTVHVLLCIHECGAKDLWQ